MTSPKKLTKPWPPPARRKWYEYGFPRSLDILYHRLKYRRPRPLFRALMMWQRSQRGWSVEDVWNLDAHLTDVIRDSVHHLRGSDHGYPPEVTHVEWIRVLAEIEDGMWAAHYIMACPVNTSEEQMKEWEREFNLAMDHLKKFWFALWD